MLSECFLWFLWWRLLWIFFSCRSLIPQHSPDLLLREIYVRRLARGRFRYFIPEPYETPTKPPEVLAYAVPEASHTYTNSIQAIV